MVPVTSTIRQCESEADLGHVRDILEPNAAFPDPTEFQAVGPERLVSLSALGEESDLVARAQADRRVQGDGADRLMERHAGHTREMAQVIRQKQSASRELSLAGAMNSLRFGKGATIVPGVFTLRFTASQQGIRNDADSLGTFAAQNKFHDHRMHVGAVADQVRETNAIVRQACELQVVAQTFSSDVEIHIRTKCRGRSGSSSYSVRL